MQNYSDLNQHSQDSGKPYRDLEVTDSYVIREFGDDIDPIELMWHRDDEDRVIESIEKTDWQIQFDDELPQPINDCIFIPEGTWHRVIKGSGCVIILIIEYA